MLRDLLEFVRSQRFEYYFALASMTGSAGFAGAAAVAHHPELTDPFLRACVVAFFGVFALQTFAVARNAWLRLHGIDPIAADLGKYEDVDPWAAASLDDDSEALAARARDLLDEVRDRVSPAADEKAALSSAIGTAAGVQELAKRDELPEKQQLEDVLEGDGGSTRTTIDGDSDE